jgi:hypothetical protein
VRRGAALAFYYRERLASVDPDTDPEAASLWRRLEREALGDLARWAKNALDADVEGRQALIAERTGALIAAAFDEALEPLALGAKHRAAVVARFTDLVCDLERQEGGGVSSDLLPPTARRSQQRSA